jgi:phosphoenolpyruvate carboxykinase (ATP)
MMTHKGITIPKSANTLPLAAVARDVHWNLGRSDLVEWSIKAGEGQLSAQGALVAKTGEFTGRSPKDKFTVRDEQTETKIDWGSVNQPLSAEAYDKLEALMLAGARDQTLFVQDLRAGADDALRINVRVVTQYAWHNLFAQNMFIRPSADEREAMTPDWTVIDLPSVQADPAIHGTNSKTFIVVNFSKRTVLIGGTEYAGEIKKSIFGVLNFLLPETGDLPMHCSANVGPAGDVALFFGLSGTGKTTLSADPERALIGDDEHGWGPKGVFNFEGGCYAKAINLTAKAEPEIYAASNQFGALLENVILDPVTGEPDYTDVSLTENTRSSYPIDFIPGHVKSGQGSNPRAVIMLTADAYGVLPPLAKLTTDQAMYHFLSGYTAKVAGTERGLGSEPQATFSTCFGAPFMPRHPSEYAALLREKVEATGAECWLVNTGWTGGTFGVGSRIPLNATRAMIRAILSGGFKDIGFIRDSYFGLMVPEACPSVQADLLTPSTTWAKLSEYEATADTLAKRFADNFLQFAKHVPASVAESGIRPRV